MCLRDAWKFYLPENVVWLIRKVDMKYFEQMESHS